MTEEVAEAAARTMSDFKAAGGDAEGIEITIDPTEAERVSGTCGVGRGRGYADRLTSQTSRIKGAHAVYAWDASTLYPWKLGERLCPHELTPLRPLALRADTSGVAHVIQQALDLGLNLQTWTPATGVTGSGGDWLVHTERGSIAAPTVIHATNAYAPALLPEVTDASVYHSHCISWAQQI
jgi:glycine/D-amino acid oxidase-like deaminating enzyme